MAGAGDPARVVDRQRGAGGKPPHQRADVVAARGAQRIGERDRQLERRLLALAGEAVDRAAVGEQRDRGEQRQQEERSRQQDGRIAPQAAAAGGSRGVHSRAR